MRTPSTATQLYAWHRAAVSGDVPAIHDGIPECGWFKTQMVKGGPWVPVRIFVEREIDTETGELTRPENLVADCGAERRDPVRLWTYLRPITREEFEGLQHRISLTPAMMATNVRMDLTTNIARPR